MFKYDTRGLKPWAGSYTVPAGKYKLRIIDTKEKQSTTGYDMVVVDFDIAEGPHTGRKIMYHYVTFLPPENAGAGIALHFLKTIGQPYDGVFAINHMNWRGKHLMADIIEERYNGRVNNKLKAVYPVAADKEEPEAIPF